MAECPHRPCGSLRADRRTTRAAEAGGDEVKRDQPWIVTEKD